MHHSTMTAEGQTTIPQTIREKLSVRPGDRILYIEKGGAVRIVAARHRLADLKGMLPKPKRPLSLDEMDAATRGGK